MGRYVKRHTEFCQRCGAYKTVHACGPIVDFFRDYKAALIGVAAIVGLLLVAGLAQGAETDQSIAVPPPEKTYTLTESELKALYQSYRGVRRDNEEMFNLILEQNEKIKELQASKNCS